MAVHLALDISLDELLHPKADEYFSDYSKRRQNAVLPAALAFVPTFRFRPTTPLPFPLVSASVTTRNGEPEQEPRRLSSGTVYFMFARSHIYPRAKRLLITADAGGSNRSRLRLWNKI